MSNRQQSDAPLAPPTGIFVFLVVAFLAFVSSLPSVKNWVGEQVLFWKIVNPLMALVSLYLVYDTFRSRAKIITRLKFIAALVWAGGRSLVIHEVLVYPVIELVSGLGFLAFLAFAFVDSRTASAQNDTHPRKTKDAI